MGTSDPLAWRFTKWEIPLCLLLVVPTVLFCFYTMHQATEQFKDTVGGVVIGPFGWPMDDHDIQWRMFRNNLPALGALAVVHLIISRVGRRLLSCKGLCLVELCISAAYILYLHAAGSILMFGISSANFLLSRLSTGLRKDSVLWRMLPLLTWAFNITALLAASSLSFFRFGSLGSSFEWLDQFEYRTRWTVHFNFVILRMISFNIDHHRAMGHEDDHDLSEGNSYRALQNKPRPYDRYSYLYYMAYLFYTPLYIAGPICSFNAWQAQMEIPQTEYRLRGLLIYAARFVLAYCSMLLLLHASIANAICAEARRNLAVLARLEMFQTICLSFSCILFLWLKFLIIWRFFRLWALLAGVLTPENMNRCVLNNYSTQHFWRSWHRSYNQWLIRYMFIPLGGNKRRLLNFFIIFNFVAIWHDLDWRLLHWAWCIVGILIPELTLTWLFSGNRFLWFRSQWYYRPICITAWTGNILLMIVANLIGFTYGLDGLSLLADVWWRGFDMLATAWWLSTVWCTCNLMFYLRYGLNDGEVVKY